jgi:RimJ/RimL family protein N-acetyltransferase
LALVDWGFTTAGYEKIVACTMAINHASRNVMEKIGMHHVRTEVPSFRSRVSGAADGEVWYELSRSGWNGNRC